MKQPPPQSVDDALQRAREHALRAASEALAAARALLDAASLATTGQPLEDSASFGVLSRGLDDLARALSAGAGAHSPPLDALLDALEREIQRWQERATNDRDARAVLRAFIGLREILWEMGVRRTERPARPSRAERPAERPSERPEPRRRVQRVDIRG
jgi:hypothetical protein